LTGPCRFSKPGCRLIARYGTVGMLGVTCRGRAVCGTASTPICRFLPRDTQICDNRTAAARKLGITHRPSG